ncbi:hypothetical protein DRP53_05600 [candidate division WOR-3 bacterium]|uniref:Uncharacterized protein n=1 Tax=candidate division WOR-3 bacterium TaxID=2052148 RepID=A0A660SHK4_UNCW3|nr:MAG: hypothetical protein DRP53_05600 [candidate division WOR-3 bacterium]
MRLRYPLFILLIFIAIMVIRTKIRDEENGILRESDPKLTVLNRYLEGRDYRLLSLNPLIFEVEGKRIEIDGPWPDKKTFEKILASRYQAVSIRFRNQLIIPRR